LINRDGRGVTLDDLAGAPWVADFIFTRCALSCPRMTRQMMRLGTLMPRRDLHRVSISVEPEYDTPEVLSEYAEAHGVEDQRWLFLTGEREAILTLARDGFLLGVDDSPPPGAASELEPILHSTRFVLVDGEGRIRGYYDASRGAELERLVGELRALLASAR
jgi:cytochrome oxidase Cu insertion factor (SCO1/SenC/PrrC family)